MRISVKRILVCTGAVLLSGASITAFTFNTSGIKWPGASTELFIGMTGTSASGTPWRDALVRAAQEWTDKTPFTFSLNQSYLDPCIGYSANSTPDSFPEGNGDGLNGIDFYSTVCGNSYGDNVLAVTLVYTESNLLGSFDITEADMVFNTSTRFDIYDGPLSQSRGIDFGRVALHEMGHVIGMSHEQTSASIMRSTIGNLFTLQPDDIEGATILYTGYSNCPVTPLDFGRKSESLSVGDCNVKQLMGGGNDDSLVDAYEFQLEQATTISIDMHSSTLDSVLVLMDAKSKVLKIDSDSGASGCDARISQTLPAGTYAVLANTIAGGSNCGDTTGPYELTLSYSSTGLLERGRETSLQGSTSSAKFAGGVRVSNKTFYSNLVKASETFSANGRITIDPRHQGQSGFIVVAGILDTGEILLRNSIGQFITYDGQGEVTKARTKVLAAVENVDILLNTRAINLGINEIEVDFLIGYGLDSNPNELYFHSAPINLLVSP